MSFKIRPEWGALPAEMVDGRIIIDGGSFPDLNSLENVRGLNIEKQQINFSNRAIQCILKNEKYTFILRWDASYTVYNNENGAIFVNYRPDSIKNPAYLFNADGEETLFGGIYCFSTQSNRQNCYIVESDKETYLFMDECSVVGKVVDKNTYYYKYCRSNRNPLRPQVYMDGNQRLYTDKELTDPIVVSEYYNNLPAVNFTPERRKKL